MTLRDVIDQLDQFSDQDTIYAEDRAALVQRGERLYSARAMVATGGQDGNPPPEAAGLGYFLEVRLAKEAIGVWRDWRDDATPTLDDKVAAVMHYAINDCYLPVD